jgi:nitrate reductase gamma subunit
MDYLFAVIIPYAAAITFLAGIMYKVVRWAAAPVPFRIPTTCGQQKSLAWVKSSRLDNPHSTAGTLGRMAFEVLLFRSLFRNTTMDLNPGARISYSSTKWLWLGGLAFHYSLLVVVVRHLRFFTEPQPRLILLLQTLDGFFQTGMPAVFVTDLMLVAALTFLIVRRLADPKLRYISLAADYFALLLIGAIAVTGILMRHIYKVDLRSIKEHALGLVQLHPSAPQGIGIIFYIHLSLVCALIAYFPFSKLMHMGGIFLSPTRNLANNNRTHRHKNPWNYDVKVHGYEEYEDEFRPLMAEAGLPLEKHDTDQAEETK